VELLERDEALAALAEGYQAAARGEGKAVFVTGEPGIGKTSLVARFVQGLGPGARVLSGTCDDLSIPRPLGPLRDLAGSVSPELERAVAAGGAAQDVQALLVAELERPPAPTVLVLEDVHWADHATLDTITVLGRRIGSLPALLVLTFRGGEAPPGHHLHATLGAIRAGDAIVVELAPLSQDGVAMLAGADAGAVYAATGGNPFYVSELLASGDRAGLPPSIATAVQGRAARLDDASRRLVELVSVVPTRVRTSVLDAVVPGWTAAAEEPERRQLLEVDATYVRFRHELARHAIRSSLPIAARRGLHAEILDALLAAQADPADIVHHAEAAGAEDVVGAYALVAARSAAALESNREAYSHYLRAADFAERLAPAERATLYEELATAAYVVGRLHDCFRATERAIAIHRELGDEAAVGRCTRALSRAHWFVGDGEPARAKALEAVAILEPLGDSVELARAYSGVSQLAMLAEDVEQVLAWGTRALELAARLGDESTRAHALVNLACARLQLSQHETGGLLEAHRFADAVGNREDATRALGNLGYVLLTWAEPEGARRYAERALAYAEEHEVHTYVSYVTTTLAWLRLRAGEWDEAERRLAGLERGDTVVQLLAGIVLAELAVRRGDPDAPERLADVAARAARAGELQRIAPVLELQVEWALTADGRVPAALLRELSGRIGPRGDVGGRFACRVAAWAAVAGVDVELGEPAPAPFAAMIRRDWAAAAAGFGEVGWAYDRALMLSLLDDADRLAEGLEVARSLGAEPLARRLAARLRAQGARVPQGPRGATRANPAGLTARQLEVLGLLAERLTNAEIAERLVVSPRTAEHHVAAVLTKLGAASRHDAVRRAVELRLVAPG
jgi:DNA-binding CsgD family transcriptional regulator/tetratricopeptide (TPR) repeat protein